ncbi:MAG: hypothetical protein ACOC04_05115 [Halothece sp.]
MSNFIEEVSVEEFAIALFRWENVRIYNNTVVHLLSIRWQARRGDTRC